MNRYGYNYEAARNTVTKNVKRSLHFMHRFNGWAVDELTLKQYPEANFEITDKENGFTYTAKAKNILEGKLLNFGYGDQRLLETQDWIVVKSKQVKLI